MTDLTGSRFGLFTVLAFSGYREVGKQKKKKIVWKVRCDCGVEADVLGDNLRSGVHRSCGCVKRSPRSASLPQPVLGARWIALTQGKFTLVDDADYEGLSIFTWRYKKGYAVRETTEGSRDQRVSFAMHREIMGAPDGIEVDHENRDRLDNRRTNLRLATRANNAHNMGRFRNNTSGVKGVHWNLANGKWSANIRVPGKRIHLGLFDELQDAAKSYAEAAERLHGAFACPDRVEEQR